MFSSLIPLKLVTIGQVAFEMTFEIVEIRETWVKGRTMTLTLAIVNFMYSLR